MSALREILAKFGVEFETGQLVQGGAAVDGMVEKLEGLGKTLAVAFGLHEIKEWYDSLTEGAIKLRTQAETIGMSADQLQIWQYAAERSHVSADAMSMALNRLQSQLYMLAQGHGGAATLFQKAGFTSKDVKDAQGNVKDVGEFLDTFVNKIGKISDEGQQKALVKMLFGRAGFRMMPFFKQGSEGIAKLRKEFQDLGGGFTPEFIEKSEEVHAAQQRVHRVFQALSIQILSRFMPYVERAAGYVEGLVRRLSEWQKQGALTNGVMALLSVLLISKLPVIIGLIRSLAGMITLPTLLFAGLVLLADELITTFQGGDTYIKDFVDGLFGDGVTARIIGNIKTINGEVQGLIANFEANSKTSSDMSLAVLAVIETIGLVFTSVFGTVEAAGRVLWRFLGDLNTLVVKLANGGTALLRMVGINGGDKMEDRSFSTAADYGSDVEKGLGGGADRIDALVKTFSAMGNQTAGSGPSLAEAMAPPSTAEANQALALAAFKRDQGTRTDVKVSQQNTFNMSPGSTKEQAKQVAGAVDEANKASYRAASNSLTHRVE